MYFPPYTIKEIKEKYPENVAEKILGDPVHLWRAETGIELIHKEPDIEEQKRIWKNWQEMSEEQKKISDVKSIEFFGLKNEENNKIIMEGWENKNRLK